MAKKFFNSKQSYAEQKEKAKLREKARRVKQRMKVLAKCKPAIQEIKDRQEMLWKAEYEELKKELDKLSKEGNLI